MAYHPGPAYMRTSRPKTPVIYANDETFDVGGLKVLRESPDDVATVIGAGVTVFEALKALRSTEGGRPVDPRHRSLFGVAGGRSGRWSPPAARPAAV